MATGAVMYANTAVGLDTPLALVTGGEWGVDANPTTRMGLTNGVIVPGAALTVVTLDLQPVNATSLLDNVLRSAYPGTLAELTAFSLEVGDDEKGISGAAWYVNAADIALAAEDCLSVGYELNHLGKHTATVGGATYAPAKTTYEWYAGSVKIGGANADVRSFSCKVSNGLLPRFSLNSKSAGSLRYCDTFDVSSEKVDGSLEFFTDPAFDTSGDTLPTATILVTAVNTAYAAATVTITATTVKVTKWGESFVDADNRKVQKCDWAADPNAGSLTIVLS